ncbi:TPA: DUF4868 domain-containing protein [Aeromonas dhakensis]|nr:DUF4868 domain-containing protein [Aeromonas dhakensis]HDX8375217.1 DUF4868 domain-containing protein [Aeromonas dhakensis]
MIQNFDFNNIVNIEFSFRVEDGENVSFQSAPTDREIKDILRQMLDDTVREFNINQDEILPYEVSEKYASKEKLSASIVDPLYQETLLIRDAEDAQINPEAINNPASIPYYRVKYYDSEERVLVAVRTASYFKAMLKQRSRLFRLVDDALESFQDSIFKLDFDFDFFIIGNDVYILRPANFESITNLGDEILEHAVAKVEVISEALGFINFEHIQELAGRSKRVARLVASVSSRDDLAQISEQNIRTLSQRTGVGLVESENGLMPLEGKELDFLEILDRRRYIVELIDGNQEAYRAQSRQAIRRV